jgi:hypothetical protein
VGSSPRTRRITFTCGCVGVGMGDQFPAAPVETSRASPPHRPRADGLACKHFRIQYPILRTPWVCFLGGDFQGRLLLLLSLISPLPCSDENVANRIGISGGGSLTGPLRDARRFPSTRWYPVPGATRPTLGFGIGPSFKGHFLSGDDCEGRRQLRWEFMKHFVCPTEYSVGYTPLRDLLDAKRVGDGAHHGLEREA